MEANAPKYYDRVFRARDAGGYMRLSLARADIGNKYFSETLPSRLDSRRKVADARLDMLKRKS